MTTELEAAQRFQCFGSNCEVLVIGADATRSAAQAAQLARRLMLDWHDRFSRFQPDSELSLLNRDPRHEVPVSVLMARLAQAAVTAGTITAGLVDATLMKQIERAGYVEDLGEPLALREALALAGPRRRAAAPSASAGWRQIEVDRTLASVRRPPGVELDSGGVAKGLFADVLAEQLGGHAAFAVNCGGDLSLGGADAVMRTVKVQSPFNAGTLHTFELRRSGVATSGIGRRSWLGADGRPAHHLLDPATGSPAFTGVVQATALAPSALMAEIRAKAAILGGPETAELWLADGGVIVLDDGSHRVIEPPPATPASSGPRPEPAQPALNFAASSEPPVASPSL